MERMVWPEHGGTPGKRPDVSGTGSLGYERRARAELLSGSGLRFTPIRVGLSLVLAAGVLAGGMAFGRHVWPVREPFAPPAFPHAVATPTGDLRINDMPLEVITSTTHLSVDEALDEFVHHFDGIRHGDPVYREGGGSRSVSIRDTDGRVHVMVAVPGVEGGASLRRFTLAGDAYMERPEPGDALPHGVPLPPGAEVLFAVRQPDTLGGRYQVLCESGLSAAAVRRFFAEELEARGWSPYTFYSTHMAAAGQASLAYVRGGRQLMIDLFDNGRGGGVDFRVSVLSRPHGLEPIPGDGLPHPARGSESGNF